MLDTALFHKSSMLPEESERIIRLLTQSPCLPFLRDKELKVEKHDNFFLELSGDVVHIGHRYTDGPAGMVLLRYAIEWHIWRRAITAPASLRLCDLAAARTASLFLTFFAKGDQRRARDRLPPPFVDALAWACATDDIGRGGETHPNYLVTLRQERSQETSVSEEQLALVKTLAASTEFHFTQGGDTRLNVDADTHLNVYGCLPFPRNNTFTFSSSTATSVSSFAYTQSEAKRQQLIESCIESNSLQPLEPFSDEIRLHIQRVFGSPGPECRVMLAPSGTDSQLHAVSLASTVLPKPLVSIVVACDETGSGTPLSATGRHFNDVTCLGIPVAKGERIEGIPEIAWQGIPLRDEEGCIPSAPALDQAVWRAVSSAVEDGYGVLLHAMDQSKLGCWTPSTTLLERLHEKFRDSVQVIVDACQTRIDRVDIQRYLDRNCIVLITGSKFYTGPPFSGAALFPRGLVERIENAEAILPEGLLDYLPACDLNMWSNTPSLAPTQPGIGAYLRWWAALVEADRYLEVPETLRRLGLDLFCRKAEAILHETDFLELTFEQTDTQHTKKGTLGTELSCRRTIFPFRVLSGHYLSSAETRRVYELLNRDISGLLTDSPSDELRLAARCCHIGQPVNLLDGEGNLSAVLRISAGARIISESWLHRDPGMFFKKIEEETDQIEFIVQKIGLILEKGLHTS